MKAYTMETIANDAAHAALFGAAPVISDGETQ